MSALVGWPRLLLGLAGLRERSRPTMFHGQLCRDHAARGEVGRTEVAFADAFALVGIAEVGFTEVGRAATAFMAGGGQLGGCGTNRGEEGGVVGTRKSGIGAESVGETASDAEGVAEPIDKKAADADGREGAADPKRPMIGIDIARRRPKARSCARPATGASTSELHNNNRNTCGAMCNRSSKSGWQPPKARAEQHASTGGRQPPRKRLATAKVGAGSRRGKAVGNRRVKSDTVATQGGAVSNRQDKRGGQPQRTTIMIMLSICYIFSLRRTREHRSSGARSEAEPSPALPHTQEAGTGTPNSAHFARTHACAFFTHAFSPPAPKGMAWVLPAPFKPMRHMH